MAEAAGVNDPWRQDYSSEWLETYDALVKRWHESGSPADAQALVDYVVPSLKKVEGKWHKKK